MTGRVVVLCGPSGVGKGTVVAALMQRQPQVWLSTSVTTRAPRPGEVAGVSYFFVTDDEFDQMVADSQLLEWATVHGQHRYGTPRQPVMQAVAAGRQVLLEVDLSGARQIRRSLLSGLPAAAELGGIGAPAARPRHRGRRDRGPAAGDGPR